MGSCRFLQLLRLQALAPNGAVAAASLLQKFDTFAGMLHAAVCIAGLRSRHPPQPLIRILMAALMLLRPHRHRKHQLVTAL